MNDTAVNNQTRNSTRSADPLVHCRDLVRIFTTEKVTVQALQGLNLSIARGELVGVIGQSGSGKSTLLNILAGQDSPTAGVATVAGHDLTTMTRRQRARYQRRVVGFVWQQASQNLLPYLTAAENIRAVQLTDLDGAAPPPAIELLDQLGVADCAAQRPATLTGSQQQCVAIAVALANRPQLLLADEPTGALDEASAAAVLEAIRSINQTFQITTLIVTHDPSVSDHVARTVAVRDGRISTEVLRRDAGPGGNQAAVAQEYVVLDEAGRMQLPASFTQHLGLIDRVRLTLEPDHVRVSPEHHPDPPPTGPARASDDWAPADAAPDDRAADDRAADRAAADQQDRERL